MATTSPPTRRSTRARHEPNDPYQDELEILAAKRQPKPKQQVEEEETLEDFAAVAVEDESDGEDSDDYEERKKKQKTKSTTNNSNNKKQQRNIQIHIKSPPKKKRTTKQPASTTTRKGALATLAKKVLDPSETPETSLVAALLHASKPIPGFPTTPCRHSTSIYSTILESIAHKYAPLDANPLHVHLLNLMFRSVGGSVTTNLPLDSDLEDFGDTDWDHLVTEVVQVMRDTDTPLLTASPKQAEYSKLYHEFWYRLGSVLLSSTSETKSTFTSNRFQVERVREVVTKCTELVPVGQPDLRYAATVAVLQLAQACLERTVELDSKLQVASRQYNAASKANTLKKMQALKISMDAWKRHKAELEELVEGPILQGVFMHRYRDSNPFIRAFCLQALSKMTLVRPDLFLVDKYLKYLGWMCSDKVASVRLAALEGLLAPFSVQQSTLKLPLDSSSMQNVCIKFLNRIVDCAEDSESLFVQETAMEMLLRMLKNEFLDEPDVMDDTAWDQVNLKALDPKTSPKVRRDALYFILEQLDSFDVEDDKSTSDTVAEKKQVERIDGIASWIANKLTDGDIAIDKIRVHLTDLVVHSLRDMPEHKSLATNWTAMLKAIRSENPQGKIGREEVAQQRVLLRMLACAAELEVDDVSDDKTNKKKKDSSTAASRQELSVALLKSLPPLFVAFKGDVIALRSLTQLPRYLIPSVFSLPSRKHDFHALINNLCAIYMECTDEEVLQHIAASFSVLVDGDHARLPDVKVQLEKLSGLLQERLMGLLDESDPDSDKAKKNKKQQRSSPKRKSTRLSDASTISSAFSDETSAEVDVEHSILICLKRWRVLTKLCPLEHFFQSKEDDKDEELEGFCNTVAEAIAKRLQDRKPVVDEDDDAATDANEQRTITVPEIWRKEDPRIHAVIANSVSEALIVLLSITAWKLRETLLSRPETTSDDIDMDEDVDIEELTVLSMRERLVTLLGVCFDQFLEESDDTIYTDEHVDFASDVQAAAGRVASDVRTLFPREWTEAADPVRRALALTNDSQLIGGFARYLQSREHELHALANKSNRGEKSISDEPTVANETALVNDLLMPLARGLTANWSDGSRREAGIVLAHIACSGQEAAHVVQNMARMLKKINPVRYLEAQMACLRLSFEKWVNSEPEELETDRPTEEQMVEFEEAEKQHEALFHSIEQQASQLSRSLGVSKITDAKLYRALIGFLQEGIRFSFHGDKGSEDELVLGSRLPFLLILSKYSHWIKKDKVEVKVVRESLDEKEDELQAHPEFDEVHDDDLAALASFRESLGIKKTRSSTQPSVAGSPSTHGEFTVGDDEGTDVGATPSPASASTVSGRRRISTASSQRSRMSAQSSLSPLYEEDATMGDSEEEASPSPQKRRRLSRGTRGESLGSSVTMSTVGNVQNRIDEGEEEEDESSGSEADTK